MKKEDVLKLKDRIDRSKTKYDQAEGAIATLLNTLSDEFECDSVEEGEKKLKQMRTKLSKIDSQIEEKMETIETSLSSG